MVRYQSAQQIKIEEFKTPFEANLDRSNRWVKLGEAIPWDRLAGIYYQAMSSDEGRPSIDARRIIGAIIVKHKLNLSDEETVSQIQENPYLQYMLGYEIYEAKPVFSPTLFVEIRKRMGLERFDKLTNHLIEEVFPKEKKSISQTKSDGENDNLNSGNGGKSEEDKSVELEKHEEAKPENKGKLIIDATVAEQAIKYPTDLDLLNDSRQISEKIIDKLFKAGLMAKKPRTYRREARKEYLATAKKRKRTRKELRKAIFKQLNYVRRNLRYINKVMDARSWEECPLNHNEQRKLWIIAEIYRQQREMFDKKEHSILNRIVSISQPHVRPMVRGKEKKGTEFGAKIGVSLVEGFAKIDNLSWESYNESQDLKPHVKNFNETWGHNPEVVISDTIYGNQSNRNYLKEEGIRYSGKPLGRPKKETAENQKEQKAERERRKKEYRERIPIEGKFGQGKNGYRLNYIRAKRQDTSESWIASIFFVMNLLNMVTIQGKKINSTLKWLFWAQKSILSKALFTIKQCYA